MQGIYQIRNIENNKVYIGSSNDIDLRWKTHKNELNRNKHTNNRLQKDWNEYGENAFVFETLEVDDEATREEIYKLEQRYIDEYKPHLNGYNVRDRVPTLLNKEEETKERKMHVNSKYIKVPRKIVKVGNSLGVIIPSNFIESMNISYKDTVFVSFEKGKIVITTENDVHEEDDHFKEKVINIINEFFVDKHIVADQKE